MLVEVLTNTVGAVEDEFEQAGSASPTPEPSPWLLRATGLVEYVSLSAPAGGTLLFEASVSFAPLEF